MPVSGECSAATPCACGSTSAQLVGAEQPQAGDAVGAAAALELVAGRRSSLARSATISLPQRSWAIPRSSQNS